MTRVREKRSVLFAHLGRRAAFSAVAVKGGFAKREGQDGIPTTLLCFVQMGRERVGMHMWLDGINLIRRGYCRPGDAIRFTAEVSQYQRYDPAKFRWSGDYGLKDGRDFVCVGPKDMGDMVDMMVEMWGWSAVADAVALHPEGC